MACSAAEIAEKVSVIEGHVKEQPSSVAQRCARIYAECNPKPGLCRFIYCLFICLVTQIRRFLEGVL